VTVQRDKFLTIKPTSCINFSNLFWKETLHVSDSSSVHHQEFFTVHTTVVYDIQVCWQFASRIRMERSSSVHHQEFFTVHTTVVYDIQVCWQFASRIRMELRSILILLENCQQTCMSYTTVVCTVKNSWWWTEELSETCRVSFQNKFEKLVQLVGFIVRTNWTTSFGIVIRSRFFWVMRRPPPHFDTLLKFHLLST